MILFSEMTGRSQWVLFIKTRAVRYTLVINVSSVPAPGVLPLPLGRK